LIFINEAHRRRLLRDDISWYHADQIHDSLADDLSRAPVVIRQGQLGGEEGQLWASRINSSWKPDKPMPVVVGGHDVLGVIYW
jgi:hypothetical protein